MERLKQKLALALPARLNGSVPCQRGTQLAEVALALPLLLLLLAATAEFGRYFYTYAVLARASRTSTRYLSGRLLNSTVFDEAKYMAVCGQTTACGNNNAVVSGLTPADVQVATTGGTTYFPTLVTVSITYSGYQPVFDLGHLVGGTWSGLTMNTSTTMRYLLDN